MLRNAIKKVVNNNTINNTLKYNFSVGTQQLDTPVIVSAKRTPIGSFNGSLASLKGSELGAIAIKAAMGEAGINQDDVNECFMGNVVSAGMGQAPARQSLIYAGLPNSVPCTTVNKVCASGMKSVIFAAQQIQLGQSECIVAGGFESMSNIPYYLPKARTGYRYGNGVLEDGILVDGLWDVYNDHHMGLAAEVCAEDYSFTREQQDEFATLSYKRAAAASENGAFKNEITPVEIKSKKGTTVVDVDEEFSRVKFDKMGSLPTPFKKDGSVTAANASSLNDGASALIIMGKEKAEKEKYPILAEIIGYGDAAKSPVEFTTAPAEATPIALANAGISADEVDLWEINEAFSVVVLANMKLMNLNVDNVNVNGGAVSLGHPIGCSGARIITTLVHALKNQNKEIGCASICNGGGGASAIVIRNVQN
eukprot:TRINITY_DN519_c0_g1_i1.p1 TRINITY_DN519_c0_g1~~TRINITY_DN519_c0_g1_i1.p1  ORF type:complete len:423 (-),score=209.85 TRINITY_DN519_c0_g1_i1:204-1472(-)